MVNMELAGTDTWAGLVIPLSTAELYTAEIWAFCVCEKNMLFAEKSGNFSIRFENYCFSGIPAA